MFISIAPPKEMNQRKVGRKRQPQPVFRQLRKATSRSKKPDTVRAFSGLPTLKQVMKLLITNEKRLA